MSNNPLPTPNKTDIGVIPPEILSEIFVYCLPADSASQGYQQVLSSVCRLWHALVLTTPALWASLDITCNNDVLRPPLPVIGAYLQRSGTHPFSFIVRVIDAKYSPSASLNLLTALTALTTARQRWCNVHISLAMMTQAVLDFIVMGDAPLLQSVKCEVSVPDETFPIPLCMAHGCPRLELFQWGGFGSPLLLPLRRTPLTSLQLRTNLTISECITVLRLSPGLLSAEFYNFHSPNTPPALHLTHTALHTLIAVGEHSIALLAALTLPALLNLNLRPGHRANPLPTEWGVVLPAFLQRSNPTLRRLSSVPHMPEPALLRVLALTPHLRILKLSSLGLPPPTAAFIRALHPPPPPSVPLCPRLQMLELSRISGCPDGLCTAMLRARWGAQAHTNGVACLVRAHIGLEGGPHDRDEAEMKELCAEGMQGMIRLVS